MLRGLMPFNRSHGLNVRGDKALMKPPMFSQPLTGNKAQDYLHRARMFSYAANELSDYSGAELNWPKYALLTHGIELSLKAFTDHSISIGKSPPTKEPKQHDLIGWYKLALQYGLLDDPAVAENIELLNELHLTHYTRYPQQRTTQIPGASVIAASTLDRLISIFTQSINRH
jgi:hypothetical protein